MAEALTHNTLRFPKLEDPAKLLIVCAPYYKEIARDLVKGAKRALRKAGADMEMVEVPGALEIPTAIALAQDAGGFDGYIALGCIIRGETTHYETVCNDSSRGLSELGLRGLCIGNGILTVENAEQAIVRADPQQGDKGFGAAEAALHLIRLKREFAGAKPASAASKTPAKNAPAKKSSTFKPASENIVVAKK